MVMSKSAAADAEEVMDVIARRVAAVVELSLLKAVANHAEPQRYPLDRRDGLEGALQRRFRQLPAERQQAVIDRTLKLADWERHRDGDSLFGDLAEVDFHAPLPVKEQAERVPLFEKADNALQRFVNQYGGYDLDAASLQLRIHKVKCHDETGMSVKVPNPLGDDVEIGGEGGEDEMYLGGIAIDPTQLAPDAAGDLKLQVTEIPVYHVGDFDDGEEVSYNPPRVLHQFDLRRGLPLANTPFSVLLVLAEHDNGNVHEIVKEAAEVARDVVKEAMKEGSKGPVEDAFKPKTGVKSTVGQHGEAGPHQPGQPGTGTPGHDHKKTENSFIVAAIVAVIVAIVVKIADAVEKLLVKWWNDDLFPPQMLRQLLPSDELRQGKTITPLRSVVFEGHDGKYEVWYDWRLIEQWRWELLDANPASADIVANGGALYQRHKDGRIWKFLGAPFAWEEIDNNPATRKIVAAGDNLYQLHENHTIWKYLGKPLTGWQLLDNNPKTVDIAATGNVLYQLHNDGHIWRYNGTGWDEIDNNAATRSIVAGGGHMYQMHHNGAIWKAMSGWTLVDNNPSTAEIAVDVDDLYQIHKDGRIWKFTGSPMNWIEIDNNPDTKKIAAAGGNLYQIHNSGRIWKFTGTPFSGWQELDDNPASADIVADGNTIYQIHQNGMIWRRQSPVQKDWRFCHKCYVLFFDGYSAKGKCPNGGGHEAMGYNFTLPYGIPETPHEQRYWRFCHKCSATFFDGYPAKGVCPQGGAHEAIGYEFVLPHDIPQVGMRQGSWRFCHKCQSLFFDGYPGKGACAKGGSHEAAGHTFVLDYVLAPKMPFEVSKLGSTVKSWP